MSREIKFRVWDSALDSMISHELIVKLQLFGLALVPTNQTQPMQYTGLKDKNGVEIFEGDILFHKLQGKCVVYYPFNESTASFGLKRVVNGFKNTLQDADRLYEVIGNIHDNPELLIEEK